MKKLIQLSVIFFSLLLFISCSNSSDDYTGPINSGGGNDVTYTSSVKAIIDGKCLGCHSSPTQNSAPMSLTTYAEVKEAVQNRGLINKVETGVMPKVGSPLIASQVQTIKDWQSGGFLQ